MSDRYRTTPDLTDKMPPGVPYIVGNEAAERFSFYGMKAILVVFMTKHLLNADGLVDPMDDAAAKSVYHFFVMAAYGFALPGALLADGLLGKYRTIIVLSLVYCLGHAALALDESRLGLFVGLGLIAVGAGGIKPCVSAHVGDQFGVKNQHLITRVFSWFYFSINMGAGLSTLLTPWLLQRFGSQIAFGIPGVLMLLATIVFWMGRNQFVHIPAQGGQFMRECFSGEGLRVLGRLSLVYLFVVPFWALYDQTGSSWVLQADEMDRTVRLFGWSFEILPSQMQAVNPFLIMLLIPIFSYVIYPWVGKVLEPTPMRRMAFGLFLMVCVFALMAFIQMMIDSDQTPHIGWQVVAYLLLTVAEILVSITGLEFFYTQAPPRMKSFVMSFWLVSVAIGNFVTASINGGIAMVQKSPGNEEFLKGASYYWLFTIIMSVAAVGFLFVLLTYKGQTYIQGSDTANKIADGDV